MSPCPPRPALCPRWCPGALAACPGAGSAWNRHPPAAPCSASGRSSRSSPPALGYSPPALTPSRSHSPSSLCKTPDSQHCRRVPGCLPACPSAAPVAAVAAPAHPAKSSPAFAAAAAAEIPVAELEIAADQSLTVDFR